MPRSCELKKMIGLLVLCFGAGIFLSFILPWRLLAFIEAGDADAPVAFTEVVW